MCVGVPSTIVAITGDGALRMARIDVAGRPADVSLAYVPEAEVGDFVLVQGGFAVTILDAQSAAESLAAFSELGALG